MSEPKVYIYWDNSNIFISSKTVSQEREGTYAERGIRIQFDNLYKLATANRNIAKACCIGSVPPDLQEVWDRIRSTGVNVETYERGKDSSKEQGLDQCLQVHMLRDIADNQEPQIVVLLTGDGQGYDDGVGFHADLERMARAGWGIEVIAWDRSCKKTLKEWAAKEGNYIKLEDYYDSVTYIKNGIRNSSPLNLTHRPMSKPKIVSSNKKEESEESEEKIKRREKYKKKQHRWATQKISGKKKKKKKRR